MNQKDIVFVPPNTEPEPGHLFGADATINLNGVEFAAFEDAEFNEDYPGVHPFVFGHYTGGRDSVALMGFGDTLAEAVEDANDAYRAHEYTWEELLNADMGP